MPSMIRLVVQHDRVAKKLRNNCHIQSGLYSRMESAASGFTVWIQSPLEYEKVLFGGMIGSWFSLLQFLTTPFVGAMSDVFGRKIPLLICLSGVSFSYALWAVSHKSFLLFCMSRTIGGLCKGNVSLSTAVVTDVSGEKDRGKGMALIGIAFSVGFIVGPMLGAILSNMTHIAGSSQFFAVPAVVALSLSVLNVVFTALRFTESLPLQHRVRPLTSSFCLLAAIGAAVTWASVACHPNAGTRLKRSIPLAG